MVGNGAFQVGHLQSGVANSSPWPMAKEMMVLARHPPFFIIRCRNVRMQLVRFPFAFVQAYLGPAGRLNQICITLALHFVKVVLQYILLRCAFQ